MLRIVGDVLRQREAGRERVDRDAVRAELARQRARERDHRALARHVVQHERHALDRRARGEVDDAAAAARLHLGTHARHARKTPSVFTSITRRHSSGSMSSNGRGSIGEKYAALLTRMSMPPKAAVAASRHARHVVGRGHVGAYAARTVPGGGERRRSLLRAAQVGDHHRRAVLREARCERAPDALRRRPSPLPSCPSTACPILREAAIAEKARPAVKEAHCRAHGPAVGFARSPRRRG